MTNISSNIRVKDLLDQIDTDYLETYIEHRDDKSLNDKVSIEVYIDEDEVLEQIFESDIKDYVLDNDIVTADDFESEPVEEISDILRIVANKHRVFTVDELKKCICDYIDFNVTSIAQL